MALLNLRPGEAKPVGFSVLQSFLMGLSRVFTLTAASTVFLEHFSAAELAYAYTASALLVAALGVIYARADKRFGLARTVAGVPLLLAAALLAARGLLDVRAAAPAAAFALILLAEAEWTLTGVTFWSMANRVFTVRQAGRLFGLISIGEVLPAIAGGLLIPVLVGRAGVTNLLFVSAGGHALAAINAYLMSKVFGARFRDAPVPRADAPRRTRDDLREIFRNRYLRFIAVSLALNTFVFFIVDNSFYHAVGARFASRENTAAFLGYFFMALGVGNLVFRLLLSGRWRSWFGLRTALLTTPASIAVLCLLVVAAPALSADPATLFWAVVTLKLIDRILVEGVNVPAFYALFQPLASRTRSRMQSTMETVVQQAATGAAGLLLVIFTRELHLGPVGLAIAGLVVLAAWLAVAWLVGQEYIAVLAAALKQHRVEPSGLAFRDAAKAGFIESSLRSKVSAHVLYGLQLAETAKHPRLAELAVELLDHRDAQIVEVACSLIERHRMAGARSALRSRIGDRGEGAIAPAAHGAMLCALAAIEPAESRAVMIERLGHGDAIVQSGAIVALYRYGGSEGAQAAEPALLRMLSAGEPKDRVAGARAAGRVRRHSLARALLPLLYDPDIEVRRAAIRAAGELRVDGLWPLVIDALAHRALRADATNVLLGAQRTVLRHLRDAYREQDEPWRARRIVEIIGQLGGRDAHRILLDVLREADRSTQATVLSALDRGGYRPTEATSALFRVLTESELANHRDMSIAREEVAALSGADLLIDAFDGELEACQARILLLLGFRYKHAALSEIRARIESREPDQVALALELLEAALPPQEAARVVPVFEALPEKQRRGEAKEPGRDPLQRVDELIEGKMPWRTSWLIACAAGVRAAPFGAAHCDVSGAKELELLDRVRLLRRIDLFAGVHGVRLAALAERIAPRRLREGELLLERGAESSSLFIVADGELHVTAESGELAVIRAEQSFGELDVLERAKAKERVAAGPETHVIELRKEDLDDLFNDDLDVAWHILTTLCRRLRARQTGAGAGAGAGSGITVDVPAPAAAAEEEEAQLSDETGSQYSTMQRVMWLKANKVFSPLDEGILAAIAGTADSQFFDEHERIFSAGEEGTAMYILLEGGVRVHAGDATIAVLDAPDIFGELAAILPAPRNASVTALRCSHVLILERSTVHELMRSQREMIGLMQALLLRRVRAGDLSAAR